MNCKSCDNGLTEDEEVNEQCEACIVEDSDMHCPSCTCNEEV